LEKQNKISSYIAVILLGLMMSSMLMTAMVPSGISNASAQTTAPSDLSQYEWTAPAADASFTRFSAGPAPNSPDLIWNTSINRASGWMAAFNGKVFVTSGTNLIALDGTTGSVVWNVTVPSTAGPANLSPESAAVCKLDNTYMLY
jgi:hypothetical protein